MLVESHWLSFLLQDLKDYILSCRTDSLMSLLSYRIFHPVLLVLNSYPWFLFSNTTTLGANVWSIFGHALLIHPPKTSTQHFKTVRKLVCLLGNKCCNFLTSHVFFLKHLSTPCLTSLVGSGLLVNKYNDSSGNLEQFKHDCCVLPTENTNLSGGNARKTARVSTLPRKRPNGMLMILASSSLRLCLFKYSTLLWISPTTPMTNATNFSTTNMGTRKQSIVKAERELSLKH